MEKQVASDSPGTISHRPQKSLRLCLRLIQMAHQCQQCHYEYSPFHAWYQASFQPLLASIFPAIERKFSLCSSTSMLHD